MVGTEGCLWTRAVGLDGNESSGYLVSHNAQRHTARCRVVLDCGSCTISSYESARSLPKLTESMYGILQLEKTTTGCKHA